MQHKKYIAQCTVDSVFRCSNWKSFDQVIEKNQNKQFKNQYPESWTKIVNEIHEKRNARCRKTERLKNREKKYSIGKNSQETIPIFNADYNLRVRLKERQQDLSRIGFVFSTRRMKTR